MSARSKLAALLLCASAAMAQEVEHRVGTYRVFNAFEYGYRSTFVAGNREVYRSSVNYNNGLRLFDGLLRVHSGDGHGRFLDELVLTTSGQGGDPYQASSLRLEKNRFFRFDMSFRVVNYYNHLLALSGGEHRFNTERLLQSYDLVLLPQRRLQFVLGFDRNNQNGPALTTEEFNVLREAAFPRDRFFVFADRLRQLNNQWRAGANATVAGIRFSFLQGLDYYRQDPLNSLAPALQEPTIGLFAQSFRRSDPVHGRTPFTRFNVHTDANRLFALNGRFVYSGGSRRFALDENITSLNPVNNIAITRQNFVLGSGQRNQGTGDLTFTLQPGQRFTFSNTTSFNQTRITGDSAFVEVRQPPSILDPERSQVFFNFLGIRLIANATDLEVRPTRNVAFHGGYHYALRQVRSHEMLQDFDGMPSPDAVQNLTHSGLAGVRLRPLPPFTVLFDFEIGRANRPFTPIGEKRFHAETLKAQWKQKTWLLSGSFKAYNNRNAPPPVLDVLEGGISPNHNYESRQYSTSFAWTPPRRYALDLSYAKLHLNTASGIINFPLPGGPDVATRRVLYLSNLHYGSATFRVELHKNAALFLGYFIVKDTAGGEDRATTVPPFLISYPSFRFDGADLINTYPLSYQSPQARLTLKLHTKISWNLGWQYYGYHETFTGLQNYHAHVSYTSLRWGF